MNVTLLGITTLSKPVYEKALLPIPHIVSGITISYKLPHKEKVPSAIAVTV